MASTSKQSPGSPMTLGNVRELGVQGLVAHCLNPACRHEGLILNDALPSHRAHTGHKSRKSLTHLKALGSRTTEGSSKPSKVPRSPCLKCVKIHLGIEAIHCSQLSTRLVGGFTYIRIHAICLRSRITSQPSQRKGHSRKRVRLSMVI